MKLSTRQIERTVEQIGASPVPDNHPVVSQLIQMYGEHTFFLDDDGLEIVEATEPTAANPMATVVKLASWTDTRHTTLAVHEPQGTEMVVLIDPDDGLGIDEEDKDD